MSNNIRISFARRAIAGMLDYSRRIPTIPVVRTINVAEIAKARREFDEAPITWSSIFIKAYARVCMRYSELRRVWTSWPYPRVYQHPHTNCAVAIERHWQGEKAVLMGRIHRPEDASLAEINGHLRHYQEADVWSVSSFRTSLRFGSLPSLLQKFVLWDRLDRSGKRRVKYLGTFGMSNYGMHGAESLHPIGPQTTVLTLGPIKTNGDVNVKIVYDHRVVDGATIARSLAHLDEVLHTVVLPELRPTLRIAA